MAVVDSDDDSIQRYIVWHHRYDPGRNERRNVVVVAFDDEHEFLAEIDRRTALLKERQRRGEAEPLEYIGGVLKRPGDAAEATRQRIEWKATRSKKARVRKRRRDQH